MRGGWISCIVDGLGRRGDDGSLHCGKLSRSICHVNALLSLWQNGGLAPFTIFCSWRRQARQYHNPSRWLSYIGGLWWNVCVFYERLQISNYRYQGFQSPIAYYGWFRWNDRWFFIGKHRLVIKGYLDEIYSVRYLWCLRQTSLLRKWLSQSFK